MMARIVYVPYLRRASVCHPIRRGRYGTFGRESAQQAEQRVVSSYIPAIARHITKFTAVEFQWLDSTAADWKAF